MDHQFGGGSWMMIPTQNPLSHDFHSLQPQFSSQQQPPPPPLQQQQHPSLASHFHLLPLVERLSEAIDIGNRDQHYESLVTELNTQFKKCQQLLDSISENISSKSMTVEGQNQKLEETNRQLGQRRDLIMKYRSHVEDLVKPENSR
ncbi:mediator of RNA polymerase II transcription subunit 9-like [Zingiber officinale]|uniref:mediator of RNA polymerase II transcription subunit 9-like n=1 Tax=Zingiber officinale TaxID=94328 RepID=UPI001C4CB8B8|nr:mediator of RNA polymerase II transcription subunit 9-like [Zingiber officinale]